MNSLVLLVGLYSLFMLTTVALAAFVFPFRKLLMNRWKLKILGLRKPVSPVLIIFPNSSISEVVVDTSKEVFRVGTASYNVRPNRFYNLFGFRYLVYLAGQPEPLELHRDDRDVLFFELTEKDGKKVQRQIPVHELFMNPSGQYVAGKVIDGHTYDNLLIRAYNAGIAWMARNSKLLDLLLYVAIGVTILTLLVVWYRTGQVSNVCSGISQHLVNVTITARGNVTGVGVL